MEIQELAAMYSRAWASRDLDAILALHTEDTVFHLHGPGPGPVHSAESVRETFAEILAQTPDLAFESKSVRFGADHFVSEYAMSGTVGGRQVVCDGADVIAVCDGRVARKDSYMDWAAYAEQVGGELSGSEAIR